MGVQHGDAIVSVVRIAQVADERTGRSVPDGEWPQIVWPRFADSQAPYRMALQREQKPVADGLGAAHAQVGGGRLGRR